MLRRKCQSVSKAPKRGMVTKRHMSLRVDGTKLDIPMSSLWSLWILVAQIMKCMRVCQTNKARPKIALYNPLESFIQTP